MLIKHFPSFQNCIVLNNKMRGLIFQSILLALWNPKQVYWAAIWGHFPPLWGMKRSQVTQNGPKFILQQFPRNTLLSGNPLLWNIFCASILCASDISVILKVICMLGKAASSLTAAQTGCIWGVPTSFLFGWTTLSFLDTLSSLDSRLSLSGSVSI